MVLSGAVSISMAVVMATMPEVALKIQSSVKVASPAILAAGGMLACFAGALAFWVRSKAKRGDPAARSIGFLTSLLMLLLFPIGTVLGLMMLLPLIHPDTKRFYRYRPFANRLKVTWRAGKCTTNVRLSRPAMLCRNLEWRGVATPIHEVRLRTAQLTNMGRQATAPKIIARTGPVFTRLPNHA